MLYGVMKNFSVQFETIMNIIKTMKTMCVVLTSVNTALSRLENKSRYSVRILYKRESVNNVIK